MQETPERVISEEMKSSMEKEITMDEIALALSQTKRLKTPRLDGIPADFYKVFFKKLKNLMLDVFKECYVLKRIFSSGRRGTIALIPKINRDLRMVKNWRPIILLCADYKILAKVIANHFEVSLNAIIHYNQSGFLKGRSILDNIRKVIDTVRICDRKKLNAILISLDFEKAFDRVDYTALSSALKF